MMEGQIKTYDEGYAAGYADAKNESAMEKIFLDVKTVLQDNQDTYENKVNDLVRAGYGIQDSGLLVSYAGTFWWWAVLQKDEKERIPERLLSDIVRLRKSYEEQLQITNTSRVMGNFGYMEGRGSTLEGFIEFLKIIEETYQ